MIRQRGSFISEVADCRRLEDDSRYLTFLVVDEQSGNQVQVRCRNMSPQDPNRLKVKVYHWEVSQ